MIIETEYRLSASADEMEKTAHFNGLYKRFNEIHNAFSVQYFNYTHFYSFARVFSRIYAEKNGLNAWNGWRFGCFISGADVLSAPESHQAPDIAWWVQMNCWLMYGISSIHQTIQKNIDITTKCWNVIASLLLRIRKPIRLCRKIEKVQFCLCFENQRPIEWPSKC